MGLFAQKHEIVEYAKELRLFVQKSQLAKFEIDVF